VMSGQDCVLLGTSEMAFPGGVTRAGVFFRTPSDDKCLIARVIANELTRATGVPRFNF
jgi:hypothetical protein